MADDNSDTAEKVVVEDTAKADAGKVQDQSQQPSGDDKGAVKSILDAGAAEGDKGAAPSTWPDNWRELMAGEDKAYLKTLSRMASPADVLKKARAAEQKLSSGEYRKVLGKDATDEERAAYRKEIGIPDKPEGYMEALALPKGVVLGDADKPLVESFAKAVHDVDMTPAQVSKAMSWYYTQLDEIKAAQEAADDEFRQSAEDTLRVDWGQADYRRNLNAVKNMLAAAPKGVGERLFGGRTADGRLIADDPETLKWMAQLALDMNPAASILPAGGADGAAMESEIEKIEKFMQSNRAEYFRDEKMQDRYRKLLEARDKTKARAA